jgi:hypothetical protein
MALPILSDSLIGKKECVDDQFLLLNPYQIPLLSMVGFGTPVTQSTHVWYEDEMFETQSTITAAIADESATTVSVADAEPFRTNQIVSVEDEFLKITAIADKALTVTRGYAGTTAAAHASGSQIKVQFTEGVEGADAREGRYKQRKKAENFTQILDDTISISGTAEATSQYGVASEYAKEQAKKQLELALQLENALINGKKFDNGNVRQMGGIRSFIQTNVDNVASAALDTNIIGNIAQDIYEAGGFKTGGQYVFVAPAKQKRKFSALNDINVRYVQADHSRGTDVDKFLTDFGEFPIAIDNNLKPDELLFIDLNRLVVRPLQGRQFSHYYLGRVGDKTQGQIVGEYTLEFQQEKAHARVTGLA